MSENAWFRRVRFATPNDNIDSLELAHVYKLEGDMAYPPLPPKLMVPVHRRSVGQSDGNEQRIPA